jgi:glycosyltransferase involved in cell wall biosynthesis
MENGGAARPSDAAAPLISVGIPVRNGAKSLARAIASVQAQSLNDVEIVLSDNASTDDTLAIAERLAASDQRLRVLRQRENLGAAGNFMQVLEHARGTYFMFLGHDDWLDPPYLERCLSQFKGPERVSLAAGMALYHRNGSVRREHRPTNLTSRVPALRVLDYLAKVHDNGVFYGLARREDLLRLSFDAVMGGDWLWVARLAFLGRVVTLDDVAIHRELGGATRSHASIVKALKLPAWQADHPRTSIALSAFGDIAWRSPIYAELTRAARYALATAAVGALGAHTLRDVAGRVRADLRGRGNEGGAEPSA